MLALTARASNKSCAGLLGIEDPEVVFAFDMECAEVLYKHDTEQQAAILTAFGLISQVPRMKIDTVREQSF